MLTVKEVLKVTPAKTKKRSKLVKVLRVKKAVIFNGKTYYALRCKTSIDQYDTEIVIQTDKLITKKNLPRQKIWCHCDCPDFKFRCEHYLAKYGSSTKILTKGRKPGDTGGFEVNPRGVPWICKHVVRALENLDKIGVKEGKLPMKLAVKFILPKVKKRIPK